MGTVVTFPHSREMYCRVLAVLEDSILSIRESIFCEHKRIQTLADCGYDVATEIACLQALNQRLDLLLAERERVCNACAPGLPRHGQAHRR